MFAISFCRHPDAIIHNFIVCVDAVAINGATMSSLREVAGRDEQIKISFVVSVKTNDFKEEN